MTYKFDDVARLPIESDNVAIATQRLTQGTQIEFGNTLITLSHDVLVGHRFAVATIAQGEPLFSWGQTFGIATKRIMAGEYVINEDVLRELKRRSLNIALPHEANFQNELEHYQFDAANFVPAQPLPRHTDTRTFMGYQRDGNRGVGTRNTIIILGVTSLVAGFVRKLEQQFSGVAAQYANIDGIVAIAHTEGGHGKGNNEDLLLRTLSGFVVHPNVGAVLIVASGHETINNKRLQNYLQEANYPLEAVIHEFMSLSASFEDDIALATNTINGWLDKVNELQRTPQPLSELKIALQCGGSDAFSGISGNPLAAWVAKEVIQCGGCANLAETDELIGAETYVLDKVRDAATAQKFLSFVERFKERVGWHGHTADGNPSGGNKFRGLYNIYLKSLGAATKRHPDVPLDYVIDYSELMRESGYYFMDSPGNDLESIAGQVASGCNMIFFVTGNGSITNFPFVPTIKIVTTTERYNLLADDMDINAGAYLDDTPLADVGADTLQYTMDVASGQLSVGEQAGHSQVQIWRDWHFSEPIALEPIRHIRYSREPLSLNKNVAVPDVDIAMLRDGDTITNQRVGLILPTSLCSGQIARMCVDALNQHPMRQDSDISRFVTLVHTEGCGGSVNDEFKDTLLGYLAHPFVKHALLLEHGCEATHNDYFRNAMMARGYHPDNYGWASIQLDGGIHAVIDNMVRWFEAQITHETKSTPVHGTLGNAQLALTTHGRIAPEIVTAYAQLTQLIVAAGGTILIHEQDDLLQSDFVANLEIETSLSPTVGYAQVVEQAGLHVMAMPTHNWGEIITGLGASGIQLIITHTDKPLHGHPMIPMLQVGESPATYTDIVLNSDDVVSQLVDVIVQTLSRRYTPQTTQSGNVNFQITRGLLGVSL